MPNICWLRRGFTKKIDAITFNSIIGPYTACFTLKAIARMASNQLAAKLGLSQNAVDSQRHGREPDTPGDELLFKFGVISDVQYADVDDMMNYEGTTMRYYRNSVNLLQQAVQRWTKEKPNFVLQLGDLIEGNHVAKCDREKTLNAVIECCKELECYVCHLWGNHEFYLFSRKELANTALNSKVFIANERATSLAKAKDLQRHSSNEKAGPLLKSSTTDFSNDNMLINNILHKFVRNSDSGHKYYFTFSPHKNFKFIALDSYDISICGREQGDTELETATKIMKEKNSNANWNSPMGLNEPHYVKFNGGLSIEQLQWLDDELTISDDLGQRVIILSHVPFHPRSTIPFCIVWNYQEVLDILWKHSCVKACLCGHTHGAGSFKDQNGIQHFVFPAVLECAKNDNAFATVNAYERRLEIFGYGTIQSCVIEL